ncbi:hypothetical protein MVEN_00158900 [Mycena venus]|uniref:NAD(P)-binding protein n=1 Tax=Mycena venus TaxID=2733690 RepID=A0A8H6Z035_9AGAR|nr:hypothetical protein MVEN_00158900 [Mycena venus]
MPTLQVAEASNAAFSPTYIPIAVFAGGTSGVGQAMAEAFARQTNGLAHIILIGRNAEVAQTILASFPKPAPSEGDGWAHEFVQCEATSMKAVRAVCAALRTRLERINFLVLTASGPKANSMVECGETPEGLDNHLAMRYTSPELDTSTSRVTCTQKSYSPLLARAREYGQPAHVMTILGAGLGFKIPSDDLGLAAARAGTVKMLQGAVISTAAMKGMMRGAAYNDGLVAWFAAQHPDIAFTHIYPGQVATAGKLFYPGWLLTPLAWIVGYLRHVIPQDECAQYMLHALLDAEHGVFIRDNHGDVLSSHVFPPDHQARFADDSRVGFLDGVPMKGYGGSDATVAGLIDYTERALSTI